MIKFVYPNLDDPKWVFIPARQDNAHRLNGKVQKSIVTTNTDAGVAHFAIFNSDATFFFDGGRLYISSLKERINMMGTSVPGKHTWYIDAVKEDEVDGRRYGLYVQMKNVNKIMKILGRTSGEAE